MRIDVHKVLLLGAWKERAAFFSEAQRLGLLEFLSSYPSRPGEHPAQIEQFQEALAILRGMPVVKERSTTVEASLLAQQLVEARRRWEGIQEELRVLKKECERVAPFGNFSLEQVRLLERETGRRLRFFCARQGMQREHPLLVYLGSAHELDYFCTFEREYAAPSGITEMQIEAPLGELLGRMAHLEREKGEVEKRLKELAHYRDRVHQGMVDALNHYHLERDKDKVLLLLEEGAFAIEGWVATSRIEELDALAGRHGVHVERIAVEAEDRQPTHLENEGAGRLGEDLVSIYDTPSTTDNDPSLWVFIAFTLFFSMIVGDGGYGLILLGLSSFLFWKFRKEREGLGRRFRRLTLALSIACCLWGTLFTSFFGVEIPLNSPLRKVSVLTWLTEKKAEYHIEHKDAVYEEWTKRFPQLTKVSDPEQFLQEGVEERDGKVQHPIYTEYVDQILLELALLIGAIHLSLSLLRYLPRNWAALGWVCFIVGSYLYFPVALKATSLLNILFPLTPAVAGAIGLPLLLGGVGLAWVLAILQKRTGGIVEVMNVIQIFADGMSYLRLYALGLAGGIMAATFNEMGSKAPFVLGIFIILFGHLVNLTLALMGGVIHGLRLNFIEWYHYSFEGGGKRFSPLTLLEK